MFWARLKAAAAAALVLALLGPAPGGTSRAFAAGACGGTTASVDRGSLVSLERVVRKINSRWPGRMLNACLDASNAKRPLYRVAWLSEGRKMNVLVDARSGRILSP